MNHPHTRPDEIFVGNHRGPLPAHLQPLKTARLGEVAYDIHGKKITTDDALRPLFVGKGEAGAYDRIMTARFNAIRRGQKV